MSTVKTPKAKANIIETANVSPFIGLDNKPAKVVAKSQLTILKMDVCKAVDGEVKSVSKYFMEFRKNFENLNSYMKEANTKGRTFDVSKCHDILMNGKMALILDSDKEIQATKMAKNPKLQFPTQWSASRMFAAFIKAVETTTKK